MKTDAEEKFPSGNQNEDKDNDGTVESTESVQHVQNTPKRQAGNVYTVEQKRVKVGIVR